MIQAVFLLGGYGTRLGLPDCPKPMVALDDKPLLEQMMRVLACQGVTDFLFLTYHLSGIIENHFKDGRDFGVNIQYLREDEARGTAGAMKDAHALLKPEFLVIYGDLVFDIDVYRFVEAARKNNSDGTLIVHPNDHPADSDLVEADTDDKIIAFHSKPHKSDLLIRNCVNAGIYYFRKELIESVPVTDEVLDWGRDIFPDVVKNGKGLHAYRSSEYIKDIGTPSRLERAEHDWKSGLVSTRSFRNRQMAVFLDRDGVINENKSYITAPNDLKILPGAAESIYKLNKSAMISICITNQAILAKGFIDFNGLERIHARLEQMLGDSGAYLDDIYFCPHYPDRGWKDEIPELKIKCDCRKPEPGLLFQAAADYNIDMTKSYMVGDNISDIEAGRKAGCRTILLHNDIAFANDQSEVRADYIVKTLESAVSLILDMENGADSC